MGREHEQQSLPPRTGWDSPASTLGETHERDEENRDRCPEAELQRAGPAGRRHGCGNGAGRRRHVRHGQQLLPAVLQLTADADNTAMGVDGILLSTPSAPIFSINTPSWTIEMSVSTLILGNAVHAPTGADHVLAPDAALLVMRNGNGYILDMAGAFYAIAPVAA